MFVTKNFSCSIFNQVHLSSRSNWRENSRGKSRGTKDTDPRAIRALSSRIVGLEFRDNWNGDDNATRSRRKIRAGMGVGTANTDYSPPLLYHPSAQKKITIFPLHPTFFLLPLFDISKAWESKRRDGFAAADWIRTQLEFRKRRERGERIDQITRMRDKTLLYPRSYRAREFVCPSRFFTTCLIYFRNRTI